MSEFIISQVIYIVGFLDFFAISLVVPVISSHLKTLGGSPAIIGFIGSVYGFLQLFSSPLVGKWSDVTSRRSVLIKTLIISSVGYCVLGASTSLWMCFFARVPPGIFKHTQSLSKAYISDIISAKDRNTAFARSNAVSALGFIFGPSLAGHIIKLPNGFFFVSVLASGILLLNSAMIWLLLPDPKPQIESNDISDVDESLTSMRRVQSDELPNSDPRKFIRLIRQMDWQNLWDIFLVKLLMGFALIIYRGNFTHTLESKFQTDSVTNGYIMSYSGVVAAISGFLVQPINAVYQGDAWRISVHFTCLGTLVMCGLIWAPSVLWVIVFLTPLGLCNSLGRATTTTLTVERGGGADRGALLGASQSAMSFARMLAPLVAGLAHEFSSDGPAYAAVVCMLLAALTMFWSERIGLGGTKQKIE